MAGLVPKRLTVTATTDAQRVKLCGDGHLSELVEIYAPNGNGGNVYLGDSEVDSSWRPYDSGTEITLNKEGAYFDLSSLYVYFETSGDSIIVTYWA